MSGISRGGIGAARVRSALREASQANSTLTSTARTDSPPAMMVISIGHDIGFSVAGMGGTARGMICGFVAGAGRASAFWSAGVAAGAGGLAAVFTVDIGSGQRVAAAGASMFALLAAEG